MRMLKRTPPYAKTAKWSSRAFNPDQRLAGKDFVEGVDRLAQIYLSGGRRAATTQHRVHFRGARSLHFFYGVGNEQEFARRKAKSRDNLGVACRDSLDSRVRVKIRRDMRSQIAGCDRLKELL